MLVKEFNKSVKAKLYDFTYTPFMSSMVIAWIVLNHKYILIYMASFDIEKKLELLKKHDFSFHSQWINIPYAENIFLPILFGLFYTFVYPKISKTFYQYTLNEKKELKKVKQKIEELTPILEEDAKVIKADNYEKTKKIFDLEESISKVENKHLKEIEIFEENSSEQIKIINDGHNKEIKSIKGKLTKEIEKSYKEKMSNLEKDFNESWAEVQKEKNDLLDEITKLNKKLSSHKNITKSSKDTARIVEDDKSKILQYFYNSNYKTSLFSLALDGIVDSTKIPRPKVSKIISELINENILEKNNRGYLFITDTGNFYLVEKFDNENKK